MGFIGEYVKAKNLKPGMIITDGSNNFRTVESIKIDRGCRPIVVYINYVGGCTGEYCRQDIRFHVWGMENTD